VSKPEINQKLPRFALFEYGLSESTEGVETNLAPADIFQDSLEAVPVKSAGPEHVVLADPSIKERRKAAVLSGIEMFRQLLGNECALLSSFQ